MATHAPGVSGKSLSSRKDWRPPLPIPLGLSKVGTGLAGRLLQCALSLRDGKVIYAGLTALHKARWCKLP
jgi:hypothetical protein